jgi:hypothetical protein
VAGHISHKGYLLFLPLVLLSLVSFDMHVELNVLTHIFILKTTFGMEVTVTNNTETVYKIVF